MNNNYSWWLTYPSEKYEFVSWDYVIPNTWKVIKKTCSSHHQSDKIELIIFIDGFPTNKCRKSSNILLKNTFFCAIYCYHVYHIATIYIYHRNWSFFSVWSSNIRILYMIANANFWSSNSLIYHRYWYHISG